MRGGNLWETDSVVREALNRMVEELYDRREYVLEQLQTVFIRSDEGKVVTIKFIEFDDEERFFLGSREEAAHASIEVYSPTSPLGSAVDGKKVGEVATYELANGKQMSVEIMKVEAYNN